MLSFRSKGMRDESPSTLSLLIILVQLTGMSCLRK
nr:MAG TPA: hypothetical protein [Microviridae sp.]